MAATPQAAEAAAAPAASSPASGALQPISNQPTVQNVVVEDNGKMAWMTGAGVVGGLCLAGPLGAVVGGCVMAAVASGHKHRKVVAVEVFPYGIQSVKLPADGIREVQGVQYFAIDITPTSGSRWRVMRRYNDFDTLRKDLRIQSRLNASFQFAPKRWHKLHGYELERRRSMLESWLSHQLSVSNRTPGFVRRLRPFLENARGVVPAAGSSNQAALPPLPDQPLPRNPTLQVTVPAGALPGQELIVVAPDGRQIKIVVPQGATAGTVLKVLVPTAASAPAASSSSSTAAAAGAASTTAAVADAAAGPVPPNATRQQSGEVLQIQVPAGATPGMSIAVDLPGGKRVQMTVPASARQGDELQMWYEPANGTLTHLPQDEPQPKPEMPVATGVAEATQLLSVQVPPGVSPGDEFAVLCPDGRQIPVVLPRDAAAKGELQVKFNALAGTVTPVV